MPKNNNDHENDDSNDSDDDNANNNNDSNDIDKGNDNNDDKSSMSKDGSICEDVPRKWFLTSRPCARAPRGAARATRSGSC